MLDIKGSTKSDTTFFERRELVEKELLETSTKKKNPEKENIVQVFEKLDKSKGKVKLSQQNQKVLYAKKYSLKPDIVVRTSISYFLSQNLGRYFNKNHHKTSGVWLL